MSQAWWEWQIEVVIFFTCSVNYPLATAFGNRAKKKRVSIATRQSVNTWCTPLLKGTVLVCPGSVFTSAALPLTGSSYGRCLWNSVSLSFVLWHLLSLPLIPACCNNETVCCWGWRCCFFSLSTPPVQNVAVSFNETKQLRMAHVDTVYTHTHTFDWIDPKRLQFIVKIWFAQNDCVLGKFKYQERAAIMWKHSCC